MRTKSFADWGWHSPICRVGAAGAALAAGAHRLQEAMGLDVKFMPLLDGVPGWITADVTVIVAGIIGGAVCQIGYGLVIWLRHEL